MEPTRSASICLHKLVLRTGFRKLGCEPGKLWKYLVHQPHIRGQFVLVDVEGQKPANIAQASDDENRRLVVSHCERVSY